MSRQYERAMAAMSKVRSEAPATYTASAYSASTDILADAATVVAAIAIMERPLKRGDAMPDPVAAGRYCHARLYGRERETFAVMMLDTKHRLIDWVELFHGTVDGAEVHPREVVKAALLSNAAAVILAHNHPSGNTDPSAADRAVTARLKQALALVDVRVLDHFVVGDGSAACSMAARGWV